MCVSAFALATGRLELVFEQRETCAMSQGSRVHVRLRKGATTTIATTSESRRIPALIKAGLLHVQFETIHPFLDGNGRIGRLLVTLYLCVNGVLRKPLLYLSPYLKSHRREYSRLLQEVREHGNWEAWLEFFLTGVADTANQAFEAATQIFDLLKEDRERITMESDRAGSALRIHAFPAESFSHSEPDCSGYGFVCTKRGRVFSNRRCLSILGEGTDPLPLNS